MLKLRHGNRSAEIGAVHRSFLALTTMPPSNLSQKLSTLAGAWPQDPLRPNLQLKNFLKSLSTHPNLTPKAVEAAQDLQRDAALKKYKLSKKTMEPASRPHYYTRLVEGYDKSMQGIARPWWKVFFNVW
ncbi:hypothetical protein FIBSPDRAFT_1038415 [Athelia psychrophila]|uniref:Uncharacterized protein n=1 Tax=Athelia psychrophila TaxID=1759441 RepID=A0A166T0J6_9AGAM|nr:hypothetical protein FIBSPDRAFT_1038415 [Fibularhizoctonia sp. CBS 109695]